MRLVRVVHPETTIAFGPLHELFPDIVATDERNRLLAHAIAFVDADSECHIFLLDEGGLKRLRRLVSPVHLASNGRV